MEKKLISSSFAKRLKHILQTQTRTHIGTFQKKGPESLVAIVFIFSLSVFFPIAS